ncbi:MAG: metal-dependent hydrolase, partial [Acidimicrobiia bacterium]|nr:metal-dependent hydrolase [Acidimicrobiia bacterium]
MSWAAHQFEIYAVHAHLPKKMRGGKVSFWGIFLGDFTPDFLSKFWVYGITINGRHYGADEPHQWHRGWPGMGFTHTLFSGIVITLMFWLWKRNRAFAVGFLLGYAAHALTDVNDSVGTMLIFPFSTLNWTLRTWAYAATVEGG